MQMSKERMNIVRAHVDAFSKGDWNRYRETVLPNVLYVERATNLRMKGVDALLKRLETWKTAFPDLQGTIQNMLVQDDMVMAEIHWEGTHQGILEGTFGKIPATGKKGMVEAIELFQFDGDKITEARHYFDLMTILAQLGVKMPAPTELTHT